MNKIAEEQITNILKNYNFPIDKFKYTKAKDNIYKMTFSDKFITYIEVSDNRDTSSQTKLWQSYRKDLIDYIKKLVNGDLFEVLCIIDPKENTDMIARAVRAIITQRPDIYCIMTVSSQDHIRAAIANNIDYHWTSEKTQYLRTQSCIKSIRSFITNTRYIMLCSSYTILHNNWVDECLDIMKKKCDVVGKSFAYVVEDQYYKLSIDQDFAKSVIPCKTTWAPVCCCEGIMFRKSLLKNIKWDITSKIFENNLHFGLHEKLLQSGGRFGYIKRADAIIATKLKDMVINKSTVSEQISSLPVIDSDLLEGLNAKFKSLTITSIQVREPPAAAPPEPTKATRTKIVKPEADDVIKIQTPAQIRKPPLASGKYNNELTSPNKIITIIICTNNGSLRECLRYINAQTVKTDILVVACNSTKKDQADAIRENYIYVDTENDQEKILYGLTHARNLNPSFIMIMYDFMFISDNWVKECLNQLKSYDTDIIGVDSYYIWNKDKKELSFGQLNKDTLTFLPPKVRDKWPMMYGLIVSNRLLHKLDWNIFLQNPNLNTTLSFGSQTIPQLPRFRTTDKVKLLAATNVMDTDKFEIWSKIYKDDSDPKEIRLVHSIFRDIIGDKLELKLSNKKNPKISVSNIVNSPFYGDMVNVTYDFDNAGNMLRLDLAEPKDFGMADASNTVVQGLWIGPTLSCIEQLCILSFIKHGHDFHLYTYEKIKNVPAGCTIKDANLILPESDIFYYDSTQSLSGKKTPAAFSNLFRYKLLLDKGGYWVDMDMVCLRPFNFKDQYVFSSEMSRDGQMINCGVMKCPKNSDFARYCYNVCRNKDKTKIKWGEIGPNLTKEGIYKFELETYVKSYDTFCPVDYNSLKYFTTESNSLQLDRRWYSVHLWNELWCRNDMNKDTINFQFISSVLFDSGVASVLNKSGVLFTWIPIDYYCNKIRSNSEKRIINMTGAADFKYLDIFLENDIYYNIMRSLKEKNIINNIHIVFCVKEDEDCYHNKFTMFEQTYLNYKNVHFWRLNNLSDLYLFRNASFIFNRGFYESMYVLGKFNKHCFIMNYPATAFYQKLVGNTIQYEVDSFQSNFPYDTVLIDESEKLGSYKSVFKRTKEFVKFHKLGFGNCGSNNTRIYDIVYFGSNQYPTKNTDLFVDYLLYLDKGKKKLSVCFVSKYDEKDKLPHFSNIHVIQKNNESQSEIKNILLSSKNNLIFSGRDANPRIISEALSCGCYCVLLNILSDGYSIIKDNNIFGKIIKCNKIYERSRSLSCYPDVEMFDEITQTVLTKKDHDLIQLKFDNLMNKHYGHQIDKIADIYKRSNKGTYVLTLATEDYLKPMNYLLSSIKHTNPDLLVVAVCVNCNKKIVNEFSKSYPDYVFYEYYIGRTYQKGDILKLKVDVQEHFFNKYEKPFIFIDADTVVVKSMKKLFLELFNHNLLVYTRFTEPEYMKFAVGVIGYGGDVGITKKLLTEYKKVTHKTEGYNNWFHDQIALWNVYQGVKREIKMYELKEQEHSLNVDKNSIIISRRKNSESVIQKILTEIRCPVVEIGNNFKDIPTYHDY
jgi:hypothetical protein